MQRSAEEGNVTADWFTAGKARNCLVNNCLKNGSGNVFAACTFVNQRLNVSFCKYTAACGNRINLLAACGEFVKARSVSFKKSSHLIDKGTCTAGTCTVHALFNAACKISNFGVFTTKFDYNISLGNDFFNGSSCRYNFLNKRNVKPL